MIRVKLPVRRRQARAARGLRGGRRALRAAAQGPHHHAPEHPVPPHPAARRREGDPRISATPGCPAARPAATPSATSPATPGPASSRASCSTPPPTPAPSSATSCATRSASCCRASSRSPSPPTDEDARSPASTTSASSRASATACAASRSAPAAAPRSCRATRSTLYEFVGARRRRVPEGLRGGAAHLRPPGRAAREPRPRAASSSWSTASASTRSARMVDEELRGRLGRRARLRPRRRCCSSTTRRPRRPGVRARLRLAERRQPRVRPLRRGQRHRAAPGRASTRSSVKVTRGDLTPEQFRGLAADHARVHRRLRAHHGRSRTSCCAGCATRASTTSGSALQELDLGDAGRARDHRRRVLPGHRQLQARHHELDGPERRDPGARSRRWGSTTR